MTLTDFLLARIAEEEAIALECGADEGGWLGYGYQHVLATDEGVAVDPPRFLADCEARAAIVRDACALANEYAGIGLRAAVRHLASVYADHPDFRAEWLT